MLVRYQYDNHLGSAMPRADDAAEVITYEEYFPYGSTAYQGVRSQTETPKRYRYTGKEREETGLCYHGARYYIPWLGRWSSLDPVGLADGVNGFLYSGNSPLRYVDPKGTKKQDPWAKLGPALTTVTTAANRGRKGQPIGFGQPVTGKGKDNNLVADPKTGLPAAELHFDRGVWEAIYILNTKEKEWSWYLSLKKKPNGKWATEPSEAIKAIFESPELWHLDCATFANAALLYAHLALVGDTAFNNAVDATAAKQRGEFRLGQKLPAVLGKISHSVSVSEGTISRGSIEKIANKAPKGSLFTFLDVSPAAKGTSFKHENAIYFGKRHGESQFIAFGIWGARVPHPLFVTEREIKEVLATKAIKKSVSDTENFFGWPHSPQRAEDAVNKNLTFHMLVDVRLDAVTTFR